MAAHRAQWSSTVPRIANPLTALEVKRLAGPGLHAVGAVSGLCLLVQPTGARSWILCTTIGARRAELGLGGYPTVSLAQAINSARDTLQAIRGGADPIVERRAKRKTVEWTFKRTALAYIAAHRAGWKSAKHADQWESTLTAYAFPESGDKHVRDGQGGETWIGCRERTTGWLGDGHRIAAS